MGKCDVVIIGAGPFGLSAAAHLRTVKGLDVLTFGEPMSFWERHMPVGMFLRSNWHATNIADPAGSLTLEAYQTANGNRMAFPLQRDRFIEYGIWYQRRAIPDLDRRKIARVETNQKGFRLLLGDGEAISSRRVVVACGISPFAHRPQEFSGLPSSLVSHTSEHRDSLQFAGKQVLVIGSGQSALESAALLHEAGADVEIVARARRIHWLEGRASNTLHHGLGLLLSKLLYAPDGHGGAGLSQFVSRPDLLRRLPRSIQDWIRKRTVRPAGARWLVKRLQKVPISLGRSVVSVTRVGNLVKVQLDDGSERTIHHILLGTGYRVDISKYDFLAPDLARSISCFQGYPRLRNGLETNVPGLHFLGAPAVWSFGPLMQHVGGTRYASQSLLRCVAGKAAPETGTSRQFDSIAVDV